MNSPIALIVVSIAFIILSCASIITRHNEKKKLESDHVSRTFYLYRLSRPDGGADTLIVERDVDYYHPGDTLIFFHHAKEWTPTVR